MNSPPVCLRRRPEGAAPIRGKGEGRGGRLCAGDAVEGAAPLAQRADVRGGQGEEEAIPEALQPAGPGETQEQEEGEAEGGDAVVEARRLLAVVLNQLFVLNT